MKINIRCIILEKDHSDIDSDTCTNSDEVEEKKIFEESKDEDDNLRSPMQTGDKRQDFRNDSIAVQHYNDSRFYNYTSTNWYTENERNFEETRVMKYDVPVAMEEDSDRFSQDYRNYCHSADHRQNRSNFSVDDGYEPQQDYYNIYNDQSSPLTDNTITHDRISRRKHKFDAVKYLTKCGMQEEYLKDLPRKCLKLIDPEYCGLCGLKLNTFEISCLHYTSKNHCKKQKRFAKQVNDGVLKRLKDKEVPLQAREQYCELCDIQLNSITHAYSHYNGKSHHSIVKGHKPPNNPVLLQRRMKSRLDELITREMKILKVEIVPAHVHYCDTCKTSVPESQMTMHLNGKKHLAEEKKLIFAMINGKKK